MSSLTSLAYLFSNFKDRYQVRMCTGYVAALNDIVLFYTDTQILADT